MSTLQELPDDFPFQLDMNGGNPIGIGEHFCCALANWSKDGGIGWVPAAIGDGQRSSSATAYLSPIVSRKNLAVLLHAQATKIIQTGIKDGAPLFSKVEFARDASSEAHLMFLEKLLLTNCAISRQKHCYSQEGDHSLCRCLQHAPAAHALGHRRPRRAQQAWNQAHPEPHICRQEPAGPPFRAEQLVRELERHVPGPPHRRCLPERDGTVERDARGTTLVHAHEPSCLVEATGYRPYFQDIQRPV